MSVSMQSLVSTGAVTMPVTKETPVAKDAVAKLVDKESVVPGVA